MTLENPLADAIADAVADKPVTVPPADKAEPVTAASVPPELIAAPVSDPPPPPDTGAAPASREDNMANMRRRIEDQQKIITELNALKAKYFDDAGALRPTPEITKALEDRDAEIKRLSDELARVDFANSPQFINKFQAPLDQTFGRVVNVVKEFGGDEAFAQRLALGSVKQRADLIKEHMAEAAPYLSPMLTRIDEQMAARDEALKDHANMAEQLKVEATVATQEKVTALRSAMRDKALSSLEADGHFVFRKVPGNEAWNTKVDQFRAAVDTIINSNDIELQTEALALSVAAPLYKQLFEEERQARLDLEKRLGQTRVATPTPGGASAGSGGDVTRLTPESAAASIVGKLFQA